MRNSPQILLLAILAATAAPSHRANAASFNCTQPSAPRERLICQTPELSRLDDQLAAAYNAARQRLSATAAALLQSSERNWLQFAATVCPLTIPATKDERRKPVNCMEARYAERLTQLEKAGQKIGPFIFNRIDRFSAQPAPDDYGRIPGFDVQHVAFPQIDNPASPEAEAWNDANGAEPTGANSKHRGTGPNKVNGGGEDTTTDYSIGWASRQLISVTWEMSSYAHGTPHGIFSSDSDNVLLRPGLPDVTAQDVFGPGNAWVSKLQAAFRNEVAVGHTVNHTTLASLDIDSFNKAVVKPDKWSFGPNGLTVEFGAYEVGCYACNPGPITVPWAALKPLLAPDAVVP